jgi:hypothetical protein
VVYVVGKARRFDERRNSSAVVAPPPDALPNALRAMATWRRENPAHAQWIADGYPTMTEAEHVERFGEPYVSHRRR